MPPTQAQVDSLLQVIAHKNAAISVLQSSMDAANAKILTLGDTIHQLNARVDSLLAVPPDTVVRVAEPARGNSDLGKIILGGLLAILGGILAQLFRGWFERGAARKRLIERIRASLEVVRVITRSTLKKDENHPINHETMSGLCAAFERYDRLSDDLHLLNDLKFQEEIDAILEHARMVGEKVLEDERRFKEVRDSLPGARVSGGTIPVGDLERQAIVLQSIVDQRKILLGVLRTLNEQVGPLLERFNKNWPPSAGHVERKIPDETRPAVPPPAEASATPSPPSGGAASKDSS